jgi:hypothetical protein
MDSHGIQHRPGVDAAPVQPWTARLTAYSPLRNTDVAGAGMSAGDRRYGLAGCLVAG